VSQEFGDPYFASQLSVAEVSARREWIRKMRAFAARPETARWAAQETLAEADRLERDLAEQRRLGGIHPSFVRSARATLRGDHPRPEGTP
jgi:uncharacterized protein with von Willebrand factor type A (vWA) domain